MIQTIAGGGNSIDAEALAKALGKVKRTSNGWLTNCPGHEDQHQSFHVSDGYKGRPVFKCHAGCSQDAVLDALKARQLWGGSSNAVIETKKEIEVVYDYTDETGKLLYQAVRYQPKDFRQRCPDGSGGWNWKLDGVRRVLYKLPDVLDACFDGQTVLVTEGEKDVDNLTKLGVVATCNAGGAGKWREEYTTSLKGAGLVAILPDNDDPGRQHAELVAISLSAAKIPVKVIELPGLPLKGDVSNWLEAGGTKEQLLKLCERAQVWNADQGETTKSPLSPKSPESENEIVWEDPVLFGDIETPEIPASLLPPELSEYVEAICQSTQTPSGMAVMLALSTVATCVQRKIEVSPYGDDYTEPLSLWTVTALPPASRKTAVIAALTAPISTWEKEELERLKPTMAEHRAQQLVLERRIAELEKKAAKTDDVSERNTYISEIADLDMRLAEPMVAPRLWTADVTPERLQSMMAEQRECMSVLSDEGGIFEILGGLYNDGRVNLDVFLQGHAGRSVRVDRGSRTVTLQKPALSFGLAVQPSIIGDFSQGSKKKFRGNGTLARFLYCLPKSNIGSRDVAKRITIPASKSASYHAMISKLLEMKASVDVDGQEQPRIVTLMPEAQAAWIQFSQYIESQQGEGQPLESIQDWTGKLPGAALRIAGLCHAVEFGTTSSTISKETMEKALDLCELLIPHAQAAFELMGTDQSLDDARHILTWLIAKGTPTFKQSDLHRTGKFNKSKI